MKQLLKHTLLLLLLLTATSVSAQRDSPQRRQATKTWREEGKGGGFKIHTMLKFGYKIVDTYVTCVFCKDKGRPIGRCDMCNGRGTVNGYGLP